MVRPAFCMWFRTGLHFFNPLFTLSLVIYLSSVLRYQFLLHMSLSSGRRIIHHYFAGKPFCKPVAFISMLHSKCLEGYEDEIFSR
jgi:hypothetical protein